MPCGERRLAVVADVHERISGIPARLEHLGASVAIRKLPAGDYRVGGGRLVERKTVRDLHLSVIEGRFFRQLGDLWTSCTNPYLLVEGTDIGRGPLSTASARGAVLVAAELGICVLRCWGPPDSAAWLLALAKRSRARVRGTRPVYAQRPAARPDDVAEAILAAVPSVSVGSARALLRHFGSVQHIVAATATDLAEVPGIGPVRAANLVEAFRRSPRVGRSRRSRERPGRAT
jgi:Fanconi anemia group M protein